MKWLTMNPHLKGCDSFARGSSVFCLVSRGLFLLLQSSCVAVIVLIWEMKMLVPIRGMVSSLLGISGYELVQSKGAFIFHQNKIWKRTFLSLKKKKKRTVFWQDGHLALSIRQQCGMLWLCQGGGEVVLSRYKSPWRGSGWTSVTWQMWKGGTRDLELCWLSAGRLCSSR